MYAIYSNKGGSDRDRRQVLVESRRSISRQRRGGPTTNINDKKNKSSSILLVPPYSPYTSSSSSSNNNNNNQERQLQIAVDDLLQEHQDEIQRPKPRCTIHHRDSFSTISTRESILISSSSPYNNNDVNNISKHNCQVKGEKRCGEFIIPTEISFSSSSLSSSLSISETTTPTEVDYNNISLRSNNSNNSNSNPITMSQIKKSSKQLPDSNVIFDLYEDDDDDIIFVPPIENDLIIASREIIMTKRINYNRDQSREKNSNTMKNNKRTIKRRESMGIINSAPVPPLPRRRRKEEIMNQLSIGISRFEI